MNDQELESSEGAESGESVDYPRRKRLIIMLLLGYSAIFGIVSCFLPEGDSPLDFIIGLPWLILGVVWCFTDAAERDYRIGRLTKLALVLMFLVGLPVYLVQTRGLGALKTLAITLLLVGAMVMCMFVSLVATLFIGGAAGLWELAI